MQFQDFFMIGMDRYIPPLVHPGGMALNLGAGHKPIDGAIPLDLPDWDADWQPIPFPDDSINTIYAFHFLEHLVSPIKVLREIERVLCPRGVAIIVVPHHMGSMAYQDLDHKHFFTTETWKTLFDNTYYDKNIQKPWLLRVHFNMIAGLNERNLALFTQLVKGFPDD